MVPVLDACCGGRQFWFDKLDTRAIFVDNRVFSGQLCDGREFEVCPDVVGDFRDLPFLDASFKLVVFDPPHLVRCGESSWSNLKYGRLGPEWREDLRRGFAECFRVLEPGGVLIFKWNEIQIPIGEVLALTEERPLFGHRSGKRSNTHWICFIKEVHR